MIYLILLFYFFILFFDRIWFLIEKFTKICCLLSFFRSHILIIILRPQNIRMVLRYSYLILIYITLIYQTTYGTSTNTRSIASTSLLYFNLILVILILFIILIICINYENIIIVWLMLVRGLLLNLILLFSLGIGKHLKEGGMIFVDLVFAFLREHIRIYLIFLIYFFNNLS